MFLPAPPQIAKSGKLVYPYELPETKFWEYRGGGAAGVTVNPGSSTIGGSWVTFTLPPPSEGGLVFGTLALDWSEIKIGARVGPPAHRTPRRPRPTTAVSAANPFSGPVAPLAPSPLAATPGEEEGEEPEDQITHALEELSEAQLEEVHKIVPHWPLSISPVPVTPLNQTLNYSYVPSKPDAEPVVTRQYDPQHVANTLSLQYAICIVTHGSVPNFDEFCPAGFKGVITSYPPPGIQSNPGAPPGVPDPILPIVNKWPGGGVPFACTDTITGRVNGALTVPRGHVYCLTNALVTGKTTVQPGGGLLMNTSRLEMGLHSEGATYLESCGSTVKGNTAVISGKGVVVFGSNLNSCPGNSLGEVSIRHNSAPVAFIGNKASSSVGVNENTGSNFDAPEYGPEVQSNRIAGTLTCSGNYPNPISRGPKNNVAGPETGQCRGF